MNDRCDRQIEQLTRKLMHDVYSLFSACIWQDDSGRILDLYQFDTLFCKPEWGPVPNVSMCILISNHPDGNMEPMDMDIRNGTALKEAYPDVPCRLLIHSEDEGIREIIF